jgi:hypothetical protein
MVITIMTITHVIEKLHNVVFDEEITDLLKKCPLIDVLYGTTEILCKKLAMICGNKYSMFCVDIRWFINMIVNKYTQHIINDLKKKPDIYDIHREKIDVCLSKISLNLFIRSSYKEIILVAYFIEQQVITINDYTKFISKECNKFMDININHEESVLKKLIYHQERFLNTTIHPVPVDKSIYTNAIKEYNEVCRLTYPEGIEYDDNDNIESTIDTILYKDCYHKSEIMHNMTEIFNALDKYEQKCKFFIDEIEKQQKKIATFKQLRNSP